MFDSIKSIKKENNELKEYSQKIEGCPTFKFYFSENIGEYTKIKSNIFVPKKDGINKIRVMISKKQQKRSYLRKQKNGLKKIKQRTI